MAFGSFGELIVFRPSLYYSFCKKALMTDPRDVIYAAIHSAFVKYPGRMIPRRTITGSSRKKART